MSSDDSKPYPYSYPLSKRAKPGEIKPLPLPEDASPTVRALRKAIEEAGSPEAYFAKACAAKRVRGLELARPKSDPGAEEK